MASKSGGNKKAPKKSCKQYKAVGRREINRKLRHERMELRGIKVGGADNPQKHKAAVAEENRVHNKNVSEMLDVMEKISHAPGGGKFFRVFVGGKFRGTEWARNRYDLFRFLENEYRHDNEQRSRKGLLPLTFGTYELQ